MYTQSIHSYSGDQNIVPLSYKQIAIPHFLILTVHYLVNQSISQSALVIVVKKLHKQTNLFQMVTQIWIPHFGPRIGKMCIIQIPITFN